MDEKDICFFDSTNKETDRVLLGSSCGITAIIYAM